MILSKKRFIQIGVCLALFVIGFIAYNYIESKQMKTMEVRGLIAHKEKDEIVAESEVIVRGKISDILESKWSNPDFKKGEEISNVLQTDLVIKTNKIYKGEDILRNKNEVVVRIDKGYDKEENMKVISDGYPDFVKNEQVLLFLVKDRSSLADDSKEYYVLLGMKQGKYTYNGENDFVFKDSDRLEKFSMKELEKELKEEIREINKDLFVYPEDKDKKKDK